MAEVRYSLSWREIVVDARGGERTLQRSLETCDEVSARAGARALVDRALGGEVRIELGRTSVLAGLGQILAWPLGAGLPQPRRETLWGEDDGDLAAVTTARADMVAALAPLRARGLIGVSEAAGLVRTMEALARRH